MVETVVAMQMSMRQRSDLPVLFDEYDRLAAEMVKRNKAGNGFNFFHFMIDLEEDLVYISVFPVVAQELSTWQ